MRSRGALMTALAVLMLMASALPVTGDDPSGDRAWRDRGSTLSYAIAECPQAMADRIRVGAQELNAAATAANIDFRYVEQASEVSQIPHLRSLGIGRNDDQLLQAIDAVGADVAVGCLDEDVRPSGGNKDFTTLEGHTWTTGTSVGGGPLLLEGALVIMPADPHFDIPDCGSLPSSDASRTALALHEFLHAAGLQAHASDDRDVFAPVIQGGTIFDCEPPTTVANGDPLHVTLERLYGLWPTTGPFVAPADPGNVFADEEPPEQDPLRWDEPPILYAIYAAAGLVALLLLVLLIVAVRPKPKRRRAPRRPAQRRPPQRPPQRPPPGQGPR